MTAAEGAASGRRSLWLGGGVLLALALAGGLAFAWMQGWLPWKPAPAFVPGALEEYSPPDTVAVVRIDVAQARTTAAGRRYLQPLLQEGIGDVQRSLGWPALAGISGPDDLRWLQVCVGRAGVQSPLWLAGTTADRPGLQIGPGKLSEADEKGLPLFSFREPRSGVRTTLAAAGPFLAASVERSQVVAALQQAKSPALVRLGDSALDKLWQKRDRGQAVWLAARLTALNLSRKGEGGALVRLASSILGQAESVAGSISCGEDIRAELNFEAADEDRARQLKGALENLCTLAGTLPQLMAVDRELEPLARLLASGVATRRETTVLLKCHLPAETAP